jgi:hypothetical protein
MRQPLKVGDRFNIILDFSMLAKHRLKLFCREKPGK